MKFIITKCSKKVEKHIRDFLDETDIEDFAEELSLQNFRDYITYGYNPWNYLEETKLNMKYQNFIPIINRIKGKFK